AQIVRDGREQTVPVEDVQVGDLLLVRPGEKIAMDGGVDSGSSAVNEAAITGEAIPVAKEAGAQVFAGSINGEGALRVRVSKLAQDTTLAKIIEMVEEAQEQRAPMKAFVDRFARYYTPAVMAAAVLITVMPPLLLAAPWQPWLYRGLSLLIIACPCALVVSTPVAIVTAIGNAARLGVLIKGGVHLEEMGRINAVAFDKTGTLTKGYPEVTDFIVDKAANGNILEAVAAVESMSQHPLARAVVTYADSKGIQKAEMVNFQSITGKGAYGEVGGSLIHVGSLNWAMELTEVPTDMKKRAEALQKEGKSVMAVLMDKTFQALIAVTDPLRDERKEVLRKLKDIGIRHTVMLTGDDRRTAEAIASAAGVTDVRANLMPEDKLTAIKDLTDEYGRVAMVGDGINDAPALAASSIGIAMGG